MRRLTSLLILLCAAAACSTGSQTVTRPDAAADATESTDVGGLPDGVILPDAPSPVDAFDAVDTGAWDQSDGTSLACEPGEGCFLDSCTDNSDCLSGWCVEHMGAGVCSQACVDECPSGWTCKQVGASDPDLVYVCVSDHANLCKPCSTGEGCKTVGGNEDVCVDYGDEGAFCGGACANDEDCPWGFTCVAGLTIDGLATTQCVADSGTCPCTAKSVALALWTPCSTSSDFGQCSGKRVCTDAGLTECDAPLAVAESCNGLDDDCDGAADEPELVDGNYIPLCDDGNDCTQDSCTGADGCANLPLELGSCDDDNPCTVADHCEAGACVGNPVQCDDDNPCTDDSCDGAGGCMFENNTLPCDDGDACSVADTCGDGVCAGTPVSCDCQSDADCGALEDGDLCNGTLVCDLEKWPYQCVVKQATVVTCPQPEPGPDAICLVATCDPATGECGLAPHNDGFACDDKDACTLGDTCLDGACTSGAALQCNDANVCTADGCDAKSGCLFEAVDGPCDDGNLCTTSDICIAGKCQGTGALPCDDDNVCTDQTCDPQNGCVTTLNAAPCDDGDVCTTGDHCHLGECIHAGTLTCNDGNACTNDSCHPENGCVFTADDGGCDDGNACTANDACVNGFCQGQKSVVCNDGNPCTDDSCDPVDGCVATFNNAPCDDGDVCTANDACSNGVCSGGQPISCNDSNPCTDDSCVEGGGCQFVPNEAACDDQNLCTLADHCQAGVCVGSGAVSCNDDNICTSDACDPSDGCLHTPIESICDDNDPCTIDDACLAGVCTGGGNLNCGDGNLCTKDLCAAPDGCYHVDADFLPCNDDNPCTTDECIPANGCVFTNVPNYTECGNGLVCLGGSCQEAPVISRVFITQGTWTGNLGGLSGADAKCQNEANAAGLNGNFVAFLSTSTVDARDRIPDTVYLRVDKTKVADSKGDLLDGSLDASINMTAKGIILSSVVRPWTSTKTDGTKMSNTCQNWTTDAAGQCGTPEYTARSGEGTATNSSWTDLTNYCCWATFTRLYCFEVFQ